MRRMKTKSKKFGKHLKFLLITLLVVLLLALLSNVRLSVTESASFDLKTYSLSFSNSDSREPTKILSPSVEPKKVRPGDTLTISTSIKSADGVGRVLADIGGIDTVSLKLMSGDIYDGVWEYKWKVHDTEEKNYTINLLVNDKKERQVTSESLTFEDPQNSEGLVGYWNFDESEANVIDYSGYGNNGTNFGSTQFTNSSCRFGGCRYFDGTDDFVSITDTGTSILDLPSSMTLSGWFKFDKIGNTGLITKRNSAGNQLNYILRYTTALNFIYRNTSGTNIENSIAWTPTVGKWHSVAVTFDNSNKLITYYVDGVSLGTDTGSGSPATDDQPVRIGNDDGSSFYLNGTADEVEIYNRALTADEIKTEYLNSVPSESQARNAIMQAIQNVLTSPTIYTDQKILIVYSDGQQKLGKFDKVVESGNQTWAVNHVSSNESFTNMASLGNVVNILELSNADSSNIVTSVESFIRQTKK